jgi:hypothetical protein
VSNVPRDSAGVADIRYLSPYEYAANSDAHTATSGFFDSNPANQIEKCCYSRLDRKQETTALRLKWRPCS